MSRKPYSGHRVKYIITDDKQGIQMMHKTQVTIMGISIVIHYEIHDPAYVEWRIQETSEDLKNEMELLNILLRTHYTGFIESACREACFYDSYATNAATDDWTDSLRYTQGIRSGLFNPQDDDDDIPF